MALKRRFSVHNNRRGLWPLAVVLTILCPLVYLIITPTDRRSVDADTAELVQGLDWRERQVMQDPKHLHVKEVTDFITSRTPKKNSPVIEDPTNEPHQEGRATNQGKKNNLSDDKSTLSPATLAQTLHRGIRHEKHAADLVGPETKAFVRLETATIKHCKSVDSAVLGRYRQWKKENENTISDSNIRFMRDQIIMARIYMKIANTTGRNDLLQELQTQLYDSQSALGGASADSDLDKSAYEKKVVMGQTLSKARGELYDCNLVKEIIREMLETAEKQARRLKKDSMDLSQMAAEKVPNAIHCLSMHLTIDYYLLPPEKRKLAKSENVEDPTLYHYAIFSDNVLAASVVVNSAVVNAKDPSKHVFHLVTDSLNFGAMNMWFLLNTPGEATIHIENVDEFKWLNSSYCPVLRQLESTPMKQFYFKPNHSAVSAGSSNLKFRNPKYLSMLNHLRFYLPEIYPKLNKILFLDDDIVVQKDLTGLWSVDLQGNVNGAVETCRESFHRFDKYLNFSNPLIAKNFDPNACGWAYGMNLFDLETWKQKNITGIYHKWQNLKADRALWNLGTLPPGLITFYGLTYPLDKSWHVLGLGYSANISKTEIEKAAVVHYNGNMKPWLELAMTRYRPYWTKYVKYHDPYLKKCKLSSNER